MTITALLGTALLLSIFGVGGSAGVLATLGVAGVVCCAACTAGDCSQDLKTGAIVGARPANQQWAQLVGIVIPALVLAPVLTLLHRSYGIGDQLKAPQATLFASLVKGIFRDGDLPLKFIWTGMGLGAALWLGDRVLASRQSGFRLHVMPVAVGLYLPITLAVPILLGGILRYAVEKRKGAQTGESTSNTGVLLGSGLIAGEALMGVLLAGFVLVGWQYNASWLPEWSKVVLSVGGFAMLMWYYMRRIHHEGHEGKAEE